MKFVRKPAVGLATPPAPRSNRRPRGWSAAPWQPTVRPFSTPCPETTIGISAPYRTMPSSLVVMASAVDRIDSCCSWVDGISHLPARPGGSEQAHDEVRQTVSCVRVQVQGVSSHTRVSTIHSRRWVSDRDLPGLHRSPHRIQPSDTKRAPIPSALTADPRKSENSFFPSGDRPDPASDAAGSSSNTCP